MIVSLLCSQLAVADDTGDTGIAALLGPTSPAGQAAPPGALASSNALFPATPGGSAPMAASAGGPGRRTFTIDNQQSGQTLDALIRQPGDAFLAPAILGIWIDGTYFEVEERDQRSYWPGTATWIGQGPGMEVVTITRGRSFITGYISVGAEHEYEITQKISGVLAWDEVDVSFESDVEDVIPAGGSGSQASSVQVAGVGPYSGLDAVVDLMIVYDPAMLNISVQSVVVEHTVNAVAMGDLALRQSQANAALRLVAVEPITDWETHTEVYGIDPHELGMCEANHELRRTTDGIADSVHTLQA